MVLNLCWLGLFCTEIPFLIFYQFRITYVFLRKYLNFPYWVVLWLYIFPLDYMYMVLLLKIYGPKILFYFRNIYCPKVNSPCEFALFSQIKHGLWNLAFHYQIALKTNLSPSLVGSFENDLKKKRLFKEKRLYEGLFKNLDYLIKLGL